MAEPTIIGLVGGKHVGKSTIAAELGKRGYRELAFADSLKVLALNINPRNGIDGQTLKESHANGGWDEAKLDFRPFLQNLGTAVRNTDPNYWIESLHAQVESFMAWERGNAPTPSKFVVSDVRYLNEAAALRERYENCILVRVIRPGLPSDDSHPSEFEHHHIDVDHIVSNDRDGVVPELAQLIAGHVNERWPTS